MENLRSAAQLSLQDFLQAALNAGYSRVGQAVFKSHDAGFFLCHQDDENRTDLAIYSSPDDATRIALHDDAGIYRPLKTAPNLAHGWILNVADLKSLHLALDLLYPAALANWRALILGERVATPLRDTVNRQTGMYRITGLIQDAEAEALIARLCKPGCLRQIQWPIASDAPHPAPTLADKEIPLLCTDACCLLIAEARTVVKARKAAEAAQ
jgi:hypothetical protein